MDIILEQKNKNIFLLINIDIMSVAELKEHLRDLGLKVSGRKAELRDRLREAVE